MTLEVQLAEAIAQRDAARAEHLLDLKEARADRDNVKTWSVALFAHVCRLTGKNPAEAPAEILALTKSYTEQWTAKRDADVAAAIDLTRAVAFEEAAQMALDHFSGREPFHLVGALLGEAKLPASHVLVPKETIEKVREALMEADCYLDDRGTSLRSVDEARAALVLLEAER